MSPAPRDGLIKTPELDGAERTALDALAEVCNRHEGLDLPLNLIDPAVQLVCYEESVLVGYVEMQDHAPKQMEVCGMVHPDHRRRGVGRSLLAGAQSECRARGQSGFLLVCEEAGPSGKGFASAARARYRYSEHRMELDAVRRPRPTSGPLRLRRAAEDDIADFVSIGAAAFRHDAADIPNRKERMTKGLADPHREYYLANLAAVPIGGLNVSLGPDESRAFINAFGVLPEHQRRGHGRQMLTEIVDRVVADGWQHVMLEVQTDNRKALSLYQACGFRETTTYDFYQVDAS